MKLTKTILALVILVIVPLHWPTAQVVATATQAPLEGFAAPQIAAVWQRDDGAVAAGQANRPWMWGPGPFHTDYEPYSSTPGASHLVQYFDKGRLEINDPQADPHSPWYVTSGLLVKEMMYGKVQVGDKATLDLGPAKIPVVGDYTTDSPTYADFLGPPLSDRQVDLTGKLGPVCLFGMGTTIPPEVVRPMAHYEPATGQNWAEPFWRYATGTLGDRSLQVLGYPIASPCAVRTSINGEQQTILVQLFERRVLTYNPANPIGTQVDMGNVGRHYYNWRYGNLHTATLNASYNVQIAIGPRPDRTTTVSEQVSIQNTTGATLDTVMLHAPWNHWPGVFNLQSARVGNENAGTTWREGINLEVRLPNPQPPGARIDLALQFELHPRPVGGRTGYDRANDILSLGDMLPTVVPWENGGWSVYPYSDLGDLGYYTHSSSTVQVHPTAGEKLIVGGTGDLTAHDPATSTYTFSAQQVRDVAYVASPRFVDPLADATMTRQVGGIKVLAYFLPEYRDQARQQLSLVTPVLDWMGRTIGPYPFHSYTVAQMGVPLEPTDNYSQEYPTCYFVPTTYLRLDAVPGTWPWDTPMHEAIHQWFYSTVANNQLSDAWLDEAMTTYATTEYIRANFPTQYAASYASMTQHAGTGRPVSSSVYSGFLNENQYSATIYDTGTQMLNRIRLAMGDTAFYAALRDYYALYTFHKITPNALLATLQKHSQVDLKPVFGQYLADE